MAIRILPTNKGGSPSFAGWTATWSNLGINNMQSIVTVDTDSTRIYIAGNNGGAAFNCFRFSLRSNPTVFTTVNTPVADDTAGAMCAMGDDETVIVGLTGVPGARVYKYLVSTGLFTDMVFPEIGTHDGVDCCTPNPTDPDIVYVGVSATAASGQASVWQLVISTATWTELFAFASSNSNRVRSIKFLAGEMYVGTGQTSGAVSRVFRSTNASFTAFTQIAGDGINGSWSAGTKRGVFVGTNRSNGELYAGTFGTTAGDAEVWRSFDHGASWTQIGGDGLNSGWSGKTVARPTGLGNQIIAGISGAAANDAEVWQFNSLTSTWSQIGGDSINGSWSTPIAVGGVFIDPDTNALFACGGNGTVNTSFIYTVVANPFNGGIPGFSWQPYPVYATFGN